MKFSIFAGLALAAASSVGCHAAAGSNAPEAAADAAVQETRASSSRPARSFTDVVYSNTPQGPLTLNIFLSDHAMREAAPVLVYFHGGAWARGAPPQTADGFKGFLREGISVVTVQYRLAGQAKAPAAVQDARCALSWLNTNAAKLHIDTERMIVTGTSAGGHLALMAGLLPAGSDIDPDACDNVPEVAAIIDQYGPTDLTALQSGSGRRHSSVVRWTGDGEEGERLEALLSPSRYISPNSPPIMIVHGDADPVVPVEQGQKLAEALAENGVRHRSFIVPGGQHGKFDAEARKTQMEMTVAFLEELGILR